MDNSIYITLSRQLALFRDMAVTANNIANANTTGFQSQKVIFDQYLEQDINQGDRNKMAFANDIVSYRNLQPGSLQKTGAALDLAITGEGYFAVQTPLGVRYTRAGNFQIDAEGTLSTVEGYQVLDGGYQPIFFPPDARDIKIGEVGNISVNGEAFGNIGVVQFENPHLLRPTAGGLYQSEIQPQTADDDLVHIAQGVLESSNVQPIVELTHMIGVSRAVGSTAKFLEVINDLQRKTTNTWAQQA